MSTQLTVIAHLVARKGHIDETKEFLLSLIDKSRSEPDCINYDLHQDNDNPAEFTFYENWTSREAWDAHMQKPYLIEFAERKEELFEIEPHIRLMSMESKPA